MHTDLVFVFPALILSFQNPGPLHDQHDTLQAEWQDKGAHCAADAEEGGGPGQAHSHACDLHVCIHRCVKLLGAGVGMHRYRVKYRVNNDTQQYRMEVHR